MENFKIENAKTRFFESKEHYLKFRQAWKDFHNSDQLVRREDVEVYSWSLGRDIVVRNVKITSLSAEHYMLYSLLRGHEASRGFSPITKEGKLQATSTWGGEPNPWAAYESAKSEIIRTAKNVEDVNAPSEMRRKWAREKIEHLLLPFGNTVSQGVLVSLAKELHADFPEFEVEEWQDFTKKMEDEKKLSIAERLKKKFA